MSHFLEEGTRQPETRADATPASDRPAPEGAVSEHSAGLTERARSRPTVGGRPHGRPSSWVLASIVVASFLAGGLALIFHLWWLVFTCAGIVAAAAPAGKLIRIMDDTADSTGRRNTS